MSDCGILRRAGVTKAVFAGTALLLAACSQGEAPSADGPSDAKVDAGEVNLYSSRHYDTDLALYENFTEQTGIKVNRIEAGADALIERIKAEGEFTQADLLITVDAGRLWRATEADLLAPTSSAVLEERVPAYLRHPEGLWFGLSKRARVIIRNKSIELDAPLASYDDLANPAHAGKVCIRSSGNIYNQSLLAAKVAHDGEAAAEAWARGVVANFARSPQGNDTGQIRAVASGECAIAVANSYYLARLAASDAPEDQAVVAAIEVIFPDQEGRGTHVNISGAGLVKGAPNPENALAFLEYLTSDTAQEFFANGNNEYPVVVGVAPTAAVVGLGAFKEDELNAGELGANQAAAVAIFDRVNWP